MIDTNTLLSVFDPNNQEHPAFRPILDWIVSGKGKLVLGGTTYRREIFVKIKKYNRLFKHLWRIGKTVEIPDREVDLAESHVKSLESSPDFDDAHLIALLDVSGCMLICSKDERAYPFLKKTELYQRRTDRPKIYRSQQNANLLCDANIAPCCEPKFVMNKTERDAVATFVSTS